MNALTRFETSTPVRYDVMNDMCTEVEARDTDLQEQINVLKDKTAIILVPSTGYTMLSQNNYKKNGTVYINSLVKKTDDSTFTRNTKLDLFTIPSGYNTVDVCLNVSCRGVGYAALGVGYIGEAQGGVFSVTLQTDGVYGLKISGSYTL